MPIKPLLAAYPTSPLPTSMFTIQILIFSLLSGGVSVGYSKTDFRRSTLPSIFRWYWHTVNVRQSTVLWRWQTDWAELKSRQRHAVMESLKWIRQQRHRNGVSLLLCYLPNFIWSHEISTTYLLSQDQWSFQAILVKHAAAESISWTLMRSFLGVFKKQLGHFQ